MLTEVRADTSTTKRTLRTTEMKTLKMITRNILNDRERNNKIRDKSETNDIVRWVTFSDLPATFLFFLLRAFKEGEYSFSEGKWTVYLLW